MVKEAPRTLYTLTPEYQRVDSELYEVLVTDNGFSPPLDRKMVESISSNFRYISPEKPPPSPVFALNKGAEMAKGELLGFMIDRARMLYPGVINYALRGFKAYADPVLITLGFHLGSKFQPYAMLEGYNQEEEDKLLESIPWRKNGYELFNISCFAISSQSGWFAPIFESNCIF